MDTDYRFSTATQDIDRALVHRWLSEESYWAKGRARDAQDAAIDASRNYSVHDVHTGRQVGYARVVTDGVTFAWLCDVFVSADARGSGVGKLLVEGLLAELDGLGVLPLVVGLNNLGGPGERCSSTQSSLSCIELLSPWPFLLPGILLIVVGGWLAWRFGRTRPS